MEAGSSRPAAASAASWRAYGGDLLAAAVREGEGQGHLAVALGGAAERIEDLAHGLREAAQVADGDEADVVLEDLAPLGDQELPEQAHERLDLAGGTRPVLLAEGVEREGVDPQAPADPDDAPHRGAARLVPGLPRLAAALGPAAVAIHDDADVTG
jgi:hypothetical protein